MDYIEQLRDRLKAAEAEGWSHATSLMAVRMTRHDTPKLVLDADWYPSPTYHCTEILGFTFTARNRVPVCVYKDRSRPWVDGTDRRISYKRALELLAQPLAESDFHKH
jgi:hypothetical protein